MLAGAVLRTLADIWHSNAPLLRCGVPMKAEGTGAGRGVISAAANRVWTADILPLTRI